MTINRSQTRKQISKGKSKIKKIIKGLSKASKTHAKQAKTLKKRFEKWQKIQKSEQVKNQKQAQEGDYTQMKIRRTLYVLRSRLRKTPEDCGEGQKGF